MNAQAQSPGSGTFKCPPEQLFPLEPHSLPSLFERTLTCIPRSVAQIHSTLSYLLFQGFESMQQIHSMARIERSIAIMGSHGFTLHSSLNLGYKIKKNALEQICKYLLTCGPVSRAKKPEFMNESKSTSYMKSLFCVPGVHIIHLQRNRIQPYDAKELELELFQRYTMYGRSLIVGFLFLLLSFVYRI